jgi:hypothetical protein
MNNTLLGLEVLGFLLFGSLGTGSQQQTTSPPTHLSSSNKRPVPVSLSYQDLSGHSTYLLEERKIVLKWFRTFQDGETILTNQDEAVPFWPTETCRLGTNRLCVGGLKVKGQTVIQVWQVSDTEQFQTPTTDPNTGLTIYPPTEIPVVEKTTVFEEDVQGSALSGRCSRTSAGPIVSWSNSTTVATSSNSTHRPDP